MTARISLILEKMRGHRPRLQTAEFPATESLHQPRGLGGLPKLRVIGIVGTNVFGRTEKIEDYLLLWIPRVEIQQRLGKTLRDLRIESFPSGPDIVEKRRRRPEHFDLTI